MSFYKNSKHTFVICAYKESPYLEECIMSLREQSIESRVIIVTSTPNLYIEKMAGEYHLPYFVNTGEGGITQDWNFGYHCACDYYDSEYITIAHQDDVYEKEYLRAVLCAASRALNPLIVFGDYYEIRGDVNVTTNKILMIKRFMLLPLRIHMLQSNRWIRRRILSFGSPICCPSVTFVRAHLPDTIFENHYRACEDWEAWERLSKLDGNFVYIPQLVMGHRIHEGSETTAAIGDNKRTEEEFEMFCKFWPKWLARVISKQYLKGQDLNRLN